MVVLVAESRAGSKHRDRLRGHRASPRPVLAVGMRLETRPPDLVRAQVATALQPGFAKEDVEVAQGRVRREREVHPPCARSDVHHYVEGGASRKTTGDVLAHASAGEVLPAL